MKIKADSRGRPAVLIKFTKRQQITLGLLLTYVRDSGGHGALLGQVFKSGIALKFIAPDKAQAIGKINGCTEPFTYYPEQQL